MAVRRYRYSSYAQMMQTPTERWRLIIAASVLLHLLIFFAVRIELATPLQYNKPKPIALILQKAPLIVPEKSPAPALAMTKTPPQVVQMVKSKPVVTKAVPKKSTKPVVKKTPPPKTTVVRNRYIKAPSVKTTTIAKTPKAVSSVPDFPVKSIGIPVQPPVLAQQTPQSNIPDNFSNAPSIGIPVIAAPPVIPKPRALAQKPKPASVKPKPPTTVAKISAVEAHQPATVAKTMPTPIRQTQLPVKQKDLDTVESDVLEIETVEAEEMANDTLETTELESIKPSKQAIKTPQLEEIQTHDIEVEKVEAQQLANNNQESLLKLPLANIPLEPIQPSTVSIETVYPIILNNLLEMLHALIPLTEIIPKVAVPTNTVSEPSSSTSQQTRAVETAPVETAVESNVGAEEKIPEQFMTNDWQKATKQSIQNNTAKELAQTEQQEKLARIQFRNHKDYGDIPDVAQDKPKTSTKKSKGLDLGVHVGDCFIGYKSKDEIKSAKERKSILPVDCQF